MDSLKKLKWHIREINGIMLLAQSSFKIVDYLYRERTAVEAEIIKHNQFLKWEAESHWRLFVIEMAKLLTSSRSDELRVKKFIGQFEAGGEYDSILEITPILVENWRRQLDAVELKIANLVLQRNKLYSHTDLIRDYVKNELTFVDVKAFFGIVQNIIYKIHLDVFGSNMVFDPINDAVDSLKKTLQDLTELRQRRDEDMVNHCKSLGIDPKSVGL